MKLYLASLRAESDQYKSVVMEAIRELLKRSGIIDVEQPSSHQVLTALRQRHEPVIAGGLSLAFHSALSAHHASGPHDSFVALVSISKDLTHGSVASLHRYEVRFQSVAELLTEEQAMSVFI